MHIAYRWEIFNIWYSHQAKYCEVLIFSLSHKYCQLLGAVELAKHDDNLRCRWKCKHEISHRLRMAAYVLRRFMYDSRQWIQHFKFHTCLLWIVHNRNIFGSYFMSSVHSNTRYHSIFKRFYFDFFMDFFFRNKLSAFNIMRYALILYVWFSYLFIHPFVFLTLNVNWSSFYVYLKTNCCIITPTLMFIDDMEISMVLKLYFHMFSPWEYQMPTH